MTKKARSTGKRSYSVLAILALVVAVLTLAVVVMSALGFRMEWWGYSRSLRILRGATYGGVAATVLAVLGIFAAWPGRGRRGLSIAVIGLVIVLGGLATPLYWNYAKSKLPPIQDISTDLENPPEFWEAPTSRLYPGAEVAAQQRAAFPDIQPIVFPNPMPEVFDAAVTLVREHGWKLVAADRGEGRIEATATSFWYGFKDDVVIRLTTLDSGTRVDIRSTSRFGGGGDGGANANRIRSFLASLKKTLAG